MTRATGGIRYASSPESDGVTMAGGRKRVKQRVTSWWFDLQSTLWFIPAIMTIVATVLAFLVLRFDERVMADHEVTSWWLFEGGAEGARGVLSTIAGTMITVVTTAFSITIVALQLASTQFSPRILKSFTGDRGNQLVLGMFIATFAYTVLVLRSIRSELADQQTFVPATAVTLAIVLAFAAIGSLIYFFHHASRAIQAPVVINRAVADTFSLIDARLGQEEEWVGGGVTDVLARDDVIEIAANQSGYVTSINTGKLLKVSEKHGVVLTISTQEGGHLLSNTTVATVPAESIRSLPEDQTQAFVTDVQGAFEVEIERTLEFDILLGFRQLSDIAIKALSPGINDPTTATTAIDRMGEGLLRVREFRTETRFQPAPSGKGGLRQTTIGFDQILDQCLPQIRHFGAGDVIVITHLLGLMRELVHGAAAEATDLVVAHVKLIVSSANDELVLEADRERVREAAAWAFAADEAR